MLSRFQIRTSSKRDADGQYVNPKNLFDVQSFNGAGTFFVHARVICLQYTLYEACPLKTQHGFLCKRKLSDQRLCSSCGHTAKTPIDSVLFRVELQDVNDKECVQNTTMFSNVSESFIGIKASEMRSMEQKGEGEELAKLLESYIGKNILAKISVKETRNDFGDGSEKFDWIISTILKSPPPIETDNGLKAANDVEGSSTSKFARK
ncbi:hypothetical protein niasHT_020894 [Heterodera trifolii]|uniref:Replication factor A C-terminal domain-containing protein n=1 Tax=Heterodera trifolii TaxID=157864 RepID=A0ABD2KS69_9BILA